MMKHKFEWEVGMYATINRDYDQGTYKYDVFQVLRYTETQPFLVFVCLRGYNSFGTIGGVGHLFRPLHIQNGDSFKIKTTGIIYILKSIEYVPDQLNTPQTFRFEYYVAKILIPTASIKEDMFLGQLMINTELIEYEG